MIKELNMKVVDLLGKEVKRIEKVKNGKTFNLQFDGSDLPQGSYQVQLEIENQVIANGNLLIQR